MQNAPNFQEIEIQAFSTKACHHSKAQATRRAIDRSFLCKSDQWQHRVDLSVFVQQSTLASDL